MATYQTRSLEEADQIIREHERKTKTTYALLRSTKNFGCVDVPACANSENEVRFETVGVPYCGVPFFVAGLKILQCQSFRGRGAKRKKDIKLELPLTVGFEPGGSINDVEVPPKIAPKKKKKAGGRLHQKVGCTATIIMKEVIYYPEFQIYEHSKNLRLCVVRQLKDALKHRAAVQKDRIIYVTVPTVTDHFGHSVGVGIPKSNSKRLYVKNDFYGHNEPGASKKAYYPVKQEKINATQLAKKLKVDEDDTETKAKEVREMLQSIMGLTYKAGTTEAFQELLRDLMQAKLRYQQTMDSLLYGIQTNAAPTVEIIAPVVPVSLAQAHQVLTVQAPNAHEPGTITMATGWQTRAGVTIPNPSVIPGTATVVAVAALPLAVTSTATANAVTVHQPVPATNGNDTNNQETSIFLEAMEAIFNPQM